MDSNPAVLQRFPFLNIKACLKFTRGYLDEQEDNRETVMCSEETKMELFGISAH